MLTKWHVIMWQLSRCRRVVWGDWCCACDKLVDQWRIRNPKVPFSGAYKKPHGPSVSHQNSTWDQSGWWQERCSWQRLRPRPRAPLTFCRPQLFHFTEAPGSLKSELPSPRSDLQFRAETMKKQIMLNFLEDLVRFKFKKCLSSEIKEIPTIVPKKLF